MIKYCCLPFFFHKGSEEFYHDITDDFYKLNATDIDGILQNFSQFQDRRLILIVNVASNCSLTKKNYKELQELYDEFQSQGLEILGFPCNQFLRQEPKCDLDVKQLVQTKFGIKFPLFSKIEVNGKNTHEVYKFLRQNWFKQSSDKIGVIPWNFAKFLVEKGGYVNKFYDPSIEISQIAQDIENYLQYQ